MTAPALPQLLLLDDETSVHRALEIRLRGFAEVAACASGSEALQRVRQRNFDAALVDVHLGEGPSGLEWVAALREADPDLAMVAFTAHGEYGVALESLRAHCFDFIPKSLRQDDELRTKLSQAIDLTRFQRGRTRCTAEVGALRAALAEAVVNHELEVSGSDIQSGLLAESLDLCSALLGRIELMGLRLAELARRTPEAREILRLANAATVDLHEGAGRLRDYFSAPECATRSLNDILGQAVRIVQESGPDSVRIERASLEPDAQFEGEGRALTRAVVILLRLMAAGVAGPSVLTVVPTQLLRPSAELAAFRNRPGARILHTPNFREDGLAVAIDLLGPASAVEPKTLAQLFAPASTPTGGASAWSAAAMLARVGALLGVEWNPGRRLRFRIVVPV